MSQLQFASLGSGSRGNGTLVRGSDNTCLLVDCGFSAREAVRRMARLDVLPEQLTGILVTHEHADHIAGVERLANRYQVPVWMTSGTYEAVGKPSLPALQLISPHDAFAVRGIRVEPFPVPHDAREPCQYVFTDGDLRLGVLSDAGEVTPHMRACLSGCDGLLLEFNHCAELLANGPYPPSLRARVGGRLGHLNNDQAGDLLARIDRSRLQHLVATHISEKNNLPERVIAAVARAAPNEVEGLTLAHQDEGLSWRALT